MKNSVEDKSDDIKLIMKDEDQNIIPNYSKNKPIAEDLLNDEYKMGLVGSLYEKQLSLLFYDSFKNDKKNMKKFRSTENIKIREFFTTIMINLMKNNLGLRDKNSIEDSIIKNAGSIFEMIYKTIGDKIEKDRVKFRERIVEIGINCNQSKFYPEEKTKEKNKLKSDKSSSDCSQPKKKKNKTTITEISQLDKPNTKTSDIDNVFFSF